MAETIFMSHTFSLSMYKLQQYVIFKVLQNPKSPHLTLREGTPKCSSQNQHQSFTSLQHEVRKKDF